MKWRKIKTTIIATLYCSLAYCISSFADYHIKIVESPARAKDIKADTLYVYDDNITSIKNDKPENNQYTIKITESPVLDKPYNIEEHTEQNITNLGLEVKRAYDYFNKDELDKSQNLVYKLMTTKYKDEAIFIQGLIYMKKKHYNKACKTFHELPYNFKPSLERLENLTCNLAKEKNINKDLMKISNNIETGDIKSALNMANILVQKHPNNINIPLSIADTFMKAKDYKDAYKYYYKVYNFDLTNARSIEGLMYASLGLHHLRRAYKYAKILENNNIRNQDINLVKGLYFAKKAENLIKQGKLNEAYNYVYKARNLARNNPYTLMTIGDFYFAKGDYEKAYKYYLRLYKKQQNFDNMLKMLYALINMNNFNLIDKYLETINAKNLNNEQKQKLEDFYKLLYTKKASYYLSIKDYKKSYEIAKEGASRFPTYIPMRKMLAWSCFNLKNYTCAEKNFKKVIEENPKDYDSIYGLALVYAKLNKTSESKKLSKFLEKANTTSSYIDIANIYTLMGDYNKAEFYLEKARKLQNLPKTGEKQGNIGKLEEKINALLKSEKIAKQKEYTDFLSIGTFLNHKSGRQGMDRLNAYGIYIYGEKRLNHNVYLLTYDRLLSLNSGGTPNYDEFGSTYLNKTIRDTNTEFAGLEPMAGVKVGNRKYFEIGIGSTPIGNSYVSPTFRGIMKAHYSSNDYKYQVSITFKRDSVRDSVLSYVGSKDPYSSKSWGRVVENGGNVHFQLGSGYKSSFLSLKAGYYSITGKNTENNYKYFTEAYPSVYLGNIITKEDYLGLFAMYENYKKSEDNFYFGDGGYFSPQNFILFGPKYTGYYHNSKLMARFNIFAGFLSFKEFGVKTESFATDISTELEYKLNQNLSLVGAIGYRNSRHYDELGFNLGLKYYLNGFYKPFRQTVDKLDNILWQR